VFTNMVFLQVAPDQVEALQGHLHAAGVLARVSPLTRLVTHLDVSTAQIERCITVMAAFRGKVS
jgi:threonine aldolase